MPPQSQPFSSGYSELVCVFALVRSYASFVLHFTLEIIYLRTEPIMVPNQNRNILFLTDASWVHSTLMPCANPEMFFQKRLKQYVKLIHHLLAYFFFSPPIGSIVLLSFIGVLYSDSACEWFSPKNNICPDIKKKLTGVLLETVKVVRNSDKIRVGL